MIFSALSTYFQMKAAEEQKANAWWMGTTQHNELDKQAATIDYNAAVAELQAKDAIIRGAEEEQKFRSKIRGTIGEQRAAFAANNIDVSFGSPVDVQADTAFTGELDALTIRTNAAREAWGYKVEAHNLRENANTTRRQADVAKRAGEMNANAADLAGWAAFGSGAASMTSSAMSYGSKKWGK